MSEMMVTNCPFCHKELPVADAAFCPYCGAVLNKKEEVALPEVRTLLDRVAETDDPVKKHNLLLEGREKFPNNLDIEREILFLGRLHERSPKKFDLTVIKCYLWQLYLTPGEFKKEQQDAMRDELVAGEQLKRCLELSPDPDAFMRDYLERLSREFVNIFLRGSTHYTRSFFGFKMESRFTKYLADPAAAVMRNIYSDEALENHMRITCYDAFYRGFAAEMSDTRYLDQNLEEMGLPRPIN